MSETASAFENAIVERVAARLREEPASVGYMSREKLAADLGVTERKVRTFREAGCPGVRVGKEVLYDPREVRKWIESHR